MAATLAPFTTGQTVIVTKGFAKWCTGTVEAVKKLMGAESEFLGWQVQVNLPGYGLRWLPEGFLEANES